VRINYSGSLRPAEDLLVDRRELFDGPACGDALGPDFGTEPDTVYTDLRLLPAAGQERGQGSGK